MQGGASRSSVPMTAYVLATLLLNGETNQKAVQYIEERLNKIKGELHSLALVAYALHLAGSSEKGKAFQMFQSRAIEKDGMKYWSDDIKIEDSYEYSDEAERDWYSPRPVDVETTGYALLTYVLRNEMSEALPIVQWLVKERNAYGGYSSTQDTVVALQALGAYAEKVYKKDNSIKLEIDVKNGKQKKTLTVQPKNVLALQSYEVILVVYHLTQIHKIEAIEYTKKYPDFDCRTFLDQLTEHRIVTFHYSPVARPQGGNRGTVLAIQLNHPNGTLYRHKQYLGLNKCDCIDKLFYSVTGQHWLFFEALYRGRRQMHNKTTTEAQLNDAGNVVQLYLKQDRFIKLQLLNRVRTLTRVTNEHRDVLSHLRFVLYA